MPAGSFQQVQDIEGLRRRVAETSDPAAASALGHLLWEHRAEAATEAAGETDVDEAIQAFALAMVLDIGEVPAPLLPRVAEASADYAVGLLERALATSDPVVADIAADLWNRIVTVLPDHAGYLSRLGIALRVQFERTGNPACLDLAVRAGEIALLRADEDDPGFPAYLCNVAVTLQVVHAHRGDPAELTRAVELLQEAVGTLPVDHPERATYLSELATSLRRRQADPTDLETAVRLARRAVTIGPPDAFGLLSNLAITLVDGYRVTGRVADLDEAVSAAGAAVAATPVGHPATAVALSNLAATLRSRFEMTGAAADLNRAIRSAGIALRTAPANDPDRAMYRANLGVALLTRFSETGRAEDLDQAVRLLVDAEAATPLTHVDRALRLSHLGLALEAAARRTGSRAQLDAAVGHLRATCSAAAADPHLPMYLSNLSNVLQTRFERLGSTADLDEAIAALTDAAARTPEPHSDRPTYLGNLAAALLTRFRHREDPADLTAAVDAGRAALRLTPPDDTARAMRMTNLGTALRTREADGDVDEAVWLCATAVRDRPADDPEYPALLSNHASTLLTRHRRGGDPADVAAAVERLREAVRSTPVTHPAHGQYLSNLGFALTRAGRRSEAAEACLAAADASAAAALVRLRAAWHAAELLAGTDTGRAATAARLATELLPRAVPRALDRTDQEDVLSRLSGVASDAAALALAATVPARGAAVEVLETGRVVLLGQLRDGHPDLGELRARRPELATRLDELSTMLDGTTHLPPPSRWDRTTMPGSPDRIAQDTDRRMALAREWDELVEQVRGLDGFEDFLRPQRLTSLLPAAAGGPVVIINVSRWRCDALIVTSSDVDVVELPRLTQEDVVARTQEYLDAVGARQEATIRGTVLRDADVIDAGIDVEAALDRCLRWMWDAFASTILDRLPATTTPTDGWQRVWWCPTGPLTLLPIHAAGHHDVPGKAVLDRVVSSYTPTLRALVEARAGTDGPGAPPDRMLFVGMPETPGHVPLPNVNDEQRLLERLLGERCTSLIGEAATRASVMGELRNHRWVHLACHGEQNLADPSHGAVLLHDGPLTVTDFGAQRFRGDFAYLSGCKTAVGGIDLLDEAITLAAALHFTGYRHVIATLWSVWDTEAAAVAEKVYEAVVRDGVLHADRAAEALHHAVRALRAACPGRPSAWTPFAHTGP